MEGFVAFCLFRQMQGLDLEIGHNFFIALPFQSII
jgi:hypothetical protein